jgi:hypothetical protein
LTERRRGVVAVTPIATVAIAAAITAIAAGAGCRFDPDLKGPSTARASGGAVGQDANSQSDGNSGEAGAGAEQGSGGAGGAEAPGADPDAGPVPTCPPEQNACAGACVDPKSLTACGPACLRCPTDPNGTTSCDGERCDLVCNAGHHRCLDACAPNNAPSSCGTACTPCPVPEGGTATCDGSKCGAACPAGQFACNGKCIATGLACAGQCPANTLLCKGMCTPLAAVPKEQCWNGEDDDCDGMPDCADSECQPVAMCVPAVDDFRVGVQLPSVSAACPASFTRAPTVLRTGLKSASSSCGGCSCDLANGSACNPLQMTLWFCGINDELCNDACRADRNGIAVSKLIANVPPMDHPECSRPEFPAPSACELVTCELMGFKVRGGGMKSNLCSAAGKPSLPAASWTRETLFCEAEQRSAAGCPAGGVCVPKPATGTVCAVVPGSRSCPAGFTSPGAPDAWYLDKVDGRSCGSDQCACDQSGGSCPTGYTAGPDGHCGDPGAVSINRRTSDPPYCGALLGRDVDGTPGYATYYAPGFKAIGSEQKPSCKPRANAVAGTLVGSGQHTVCCR